MTQSMTQSTLSTDPARWIEVEVDSTAPVDAPAFIPRTHQENLGPISDLLPESWQYHAELIEEYYKKRPWQVFVRLIQILLPFTSFILGIWLDKLWRRGEEQRQRRAVQFKKILTQLGPTYIKIGQALSTRPDLVSPLYLVELTSLQDQLPSFPNEVAFRFIEEELGAKPDEIYAELSENPIAAASLGQVYRGRLKTGEKVAVKVQRPDLIRNITLDIHIMRTMALWAKKYIKRVRSDLVAITDELAGRIFEELNYIQEGHNAERFAELYGHMAEIYIPRIYWQYTGRRVLTMEWIDGVKLTHTKEIQAMGVDPTHLVDLGVQCSLRQLLEHGFFHADPHPGNLLAMPDGKLAYLDFGMMSNIKPYQRYGLIEAVVHLVNRDFEALAQDYVNLDFLTPETDLRPIIPALSQVFGNALGASVAELNFKSITDQMSAMMYEFPFRVPAYYALIIRSMVTLEGIAIGIDPNFKVLSKAYPYIAKRLLTDPSPELRASLRDLLFKDGSFRWNRLENLLNNAGNSDEFDFDRLLDQASDFLFSERGEFIRDRLVSELIDTIDIFGRRTWFNLTAAVREQVGMAVQELPIELQQKSKAFEHISNIVQILRNTNGFDPIRLITVGTKLLSKPETHFLGQRVAEGLVQKALTRLIRTVLLDLDREPKPIAPPVAQDRPLLPSV